jgi:hypothetical protein
MHKGKAKAGDDFWLKARSLALGFLQSLFKSHGN